MPPWRAAASWLLSTLMPACIAVCSRRSTWMAVQRALVLAVGVVADSGGTVAVIPAAGQFGCERVERLRVQRADPDLSQQGPDVLVDIALVTLTGALLNGELGQVLVQQLVNGGVGPRMAFLGNLVNQPDARLLGLRRSAWSRRDDLGEVQVLLRDHVHARVDTHTDSPAGQCVEVSS